MQVPVCVRSFSIDCGHRVFRHESKCANVHGHTYRIEVHARAASLDALGRVIDFSVLKERIGTWLDVNWDHGFVLNADDAEIHMALMALASKFYLMPYNPTAENMAKYLLVAIIPALMAGTNVEVFKVVVHETPNCYAEAAL
jgi:6-pyruvoyltetrahydropterin/6-carboxytetrahydropterin synthase